MVETLYDNRSVRLVRHIPEVNKSPDKIVITFQTIVGKLKDAGFGTIFFNKRGIENIFVSHKGNSFYQNLSIEDFYEIVRPYIKDKSVYLYGSSLGGYAAIYYSGVVDGQAIALSPRCSADPIYAENRVDVDFKHFLLSDLTDNFTSSKSPIIAYDPHIVKDKIFVEERVVVKYPASHLIRIPYGMHPVGVVMNNSGVLKEFVMGAIENNSVNIELIKKIDILTSPSYTFRVAKNALINNNENDFNDHLFHCLKWGGHRKIVPLIRRSINKGMLKFKIESSDIPQSARNLHMKNKLSNPDLSLFQGIAIALIESLDYKSATALLNVRTDDIDDGNAALLKKKLVKDISLMCSLPSYDKYKSLRL